MEDGRAEQRNFHRCQVDKEDYPMLQLIQSNKKGITIDNKKEKQHWNQMSVYIHRFVVPAKDGAKALLP